LGFLESRWGQVILNIARTRKLGQKSEHAKKVAPIVTGEDDGTSTLKEFEARNEG